MAIIFPAAIRNATSGQLKEIARTGSSQSGLYTTTHLKNFVQSEKYLTGLIRKTEPIGEFMSTLEQNRQDIESSTEAIRVASCKLVEICKEANDGMVDSGRKMRDATEKVGVAISKFNQIAAAANLTKMAEDAERLADSLERLSKFQESGQLQRLVSAMSQRP